MTKRSGTKSSIAVRNATTGRYLSTVAGEIKRPATTVRSPLKGPSPESAVKAVAARVAGSRAAADRWYVKSNDLLGGRSPRQAVKDGEREKVLALLLNVAGQ